ncbi:MAG: J domain-containing protein [Deltaproteobacteria bacterium]|nr:J domain-containing protein [Deltaproteobacteria bacterium]
MNKYQEITRARRLLELSETASIAEIKANYRRLLAKWHPDKCIDKKGKCTKKTREIIAAYKKILDYCNCYQYSFSEETVKRHLSPEQWWSERFGDDPLWGKGNKSK